MTTEELLKKDLAIHERGCAYRQNLESFIHKVGVYQETGKGLDHNFDKGCDCP